MCYKIPSSFICFRSYASKISELPTFMIMVIKLEEVVDDEYAEIYIPKDFPGDCRWW